MFFFALFFLSFKVASQVTTFETAAFASESLAFEVLATKKSKVNELSFFT